MFNLLSNVTPIIFTASLMLIVVVIPTFKDKLTYQYHYNTRQSRSLHSSVGRGEAIYRSFSFHGVNIWNYLSKHIPTNVSYNRFNKLTKSYLLNNNIIYRLV